MQGSGFALLAAVCEARSERCQAADKNQRVSIAIRYEHERDVSYGYAHESDPSVLL